MQPNPMLYAFDPSIPRDEVLATLAVMPSRLREVVARAAPRALERRPGPDEWSAFQVVCHVRDAALAYTGRFRWMVFDDDPFLPNFDENNWVAASRDTVADLSAILDEIAASRADLIRVLSRLPESGWQRTGRHEVAGTVVLDHYVRHHAAHEQLHLAQIAAALSAR
jgi:uncharacterized damage-inducible protein DinB